MTALDSALDALYATFGDVVKPEVVDGCSHCWDPERAKVLVAKPLRALSKGELSDFGASVFLTAGTVEDFRYLLPRLLEIGATDEHFWPSPEVLLEKLKLAGWKDWSETERGAIQAVLDAWFDEKLAAAPDGRGAAWWDGDSLICGLAAAGIDLEPYLSRLLDPRFAPQLLALYRMNFDPRTGRVRPGNSFWRKSDDHALWDEDKPSADQLVAFLESPEVEGRLW